MASRALALLDRGVAVVAGALVVALLTSVTLGVITRAWDDPLAWTDELSRLLMVWLAMFGWILSTRRNAHVRIRFFQGLLPLGPRRVVEAVIQAGLVVLGLLAAWFGFNLVQRNADLDATSLPLSMAWFYAPVIPAGFATALQALHDLGGQVRRTRGSPVGESLVE